MEYFKIEKC